MFEDKKLVVVHHLDAPEAERVRLVVPYVVSEAAVAELLAHQDLALVALVTAAVWPRARDLEAVAGRYERRNPKHVTVGAEPLPDFELASETAISSAASSPPDRGNGECPQQRGDDTGNYADQKVAAVHASSVWRAPDVTMSLSAN